MLTAELQRWLAPGPPDDLAGLALARLVTREVRWVGTHHLDPALLADLAAVRDRYAGREPILDDFLDCVLAKYDGRYWNRTYLCLPVLERLIDGPDAALDPVGLAALLAADVVRHELCASRRGKRVSPLDRPDGRTLHTRVRQAGAVQVRQPRRGAGHRPARRRRARPDGGTAGHPRRLPVAPDPWAADWLEVTVQPVSTVHDEYFFIRALQGHEIVYGVAARSVADAVTALAEGRPGEAARCVDRATVMVERGQSLFRMVATMRYDAFHTFREFTQGASAIQSEQYKRFEAALLDADGGPPRLAGVRPGPRRAGRAGGEPRHADGGLARRRPPHAGRPRGRPGGREHGGARGRAPAVEEHARHRRDADAGRRPGERRHLGRLLPAGVAGPPPVRRRPGRCRCPRSRRRGRPTVSRSRGPRASSP